MIQNFVFVSISQRYWYTVNRFKRTGGMGPKGGGSVPWKKQIMNQFKSFPVKIGTDEPAGGSIIVFDGNPKVGFLVSNYEYDGTSGDGWCFGVGGPGVVSEPGRWRSIYCMGDHVFNVDRPTGYAGRTVTSFYTEEEQEDLLAAITASNIHALVVRMAGEKKFSQWAQKYIPKIMVVEGDVAAFLIPSEVRPMIRDKSRDKRIF